MYEIEIIFKFIYTDYYNFRVLCVVVRVCTTILL